MSLLEELYYALPPVDERTVPKSQEQKKLERRAGELRSLCNSLLDDRGQKALDTLLCTRTELCSLSQCRTFVHAMRLGAALTLDLLEDGNTLAVY